MAAQGFLLIASFLLLLMVLARPTGTLLARMINDTPLPVLAGIERGIWRLSGIRPQEMNWYQYLLAILLFNGVGLVGLFALLMSQGALPLNPQHLPGLSWDLALNTAVSFVSNTNWQAYAGESTLSYLSQMAGLTVQNFLSAATGIAVIFAFTRAWSRQQVSTLGNAWVDLTRITLWLLLPISLLIAVFFIQQGVPQNFLPYQAFTTLEGVHQSLPMGPVASQEAIKMLGTNGGGVFNANSSHPFENPTALSNIVQMLAIFLIPAALCFAFGDVVGDRRQGHAILWAMALIFIVCVAVVMWAETHGNPHLLQLGTDSSLNMEGKESRFGILASSLFAVVTTAASCGAVNAMHDSFTALGGMVPMWLMQIGEVVFGGVGSGLYGMLLFVMLAVFIAGLMIGRTPEYLGKKIDVREMKMIALAILVTPTLVLLGTALAMAVDHEIGMVSLVRNLEEFFARESCGWCTPCRDGLPWSVKILRALERGEGQPGDIETLEQLCRFLGPGKTFCAHAPGAVEPLQSAIKYFRDEFEAGIKQQFSNTHAINGIQPNLLKTRW